MQADESKKNLPLCIACKGTIHPEAITLNPDSHHARDERVQLAMLLRSIFTKNKERAPKPWQCINPSRNLWQEQDTKTAF